MPCQHNAKRTSGRQSAVAAADIQPDALQALLDALPAPLEPLDVVMLDGFACGVALQPTELDPQLWLPFVLDLEGRAAPVGPRVNAATQAVLARHATLRTAIEHRQWFDPWIYELDSDTPAAAAVAPWAAGFAMAVEHFALPLDRQAGAAREALALIYQGLEADDWPDAGELQAEIDAIEPPSNLEEAVEDLVRASLLLADLVASARSARPQSRPTRRKSPSAAGRKPRPR